MFDADKVVKVDICTNNGNLLQSLKKGYTFPKVQSAEHTQVKLLIIKGSNMPLYPRGSPVVTVVYLKSGDRLSYTSVVTVSTETQLNIGIYLDRKVVLEDRRRYFKVECDLPCRIMGLARGTERVDYDPMLYGRILNLNIGGVFLSVESESDFKVGDVVSAVIPELNKEGPGYLLNVLRTQTAPDGNFMGYGCKFLYLTPAREEFLGQYINMIQVEKRWQSRSG